MWHPCRYRDMNVASMSLPLTGAGTANGSGEVGLGDAVGVAGRPLDQLDPVAVRVGNPAGPRPVRAAGRPGRLGRDPARGQLGQRLLERLDLDNEMADTGAEVDRALGRVMDQLD